MLPLSEPLVSVIIPCFNAEKYVAEAIRSALDQTYSRCEVIVVDDGSTDNSLDIIKSFGDRVRWETGPNRGGCAARNRGLTLAKGKWIQFLDADDLISKDKIRLQIEGMCKAPEYSMSTCSWGFFDEDEPLVLQSRLFWKDYRRGVDLLVDMWLDGGYFCQHCWLVSKAQIEQCGGWNERLKADQDGEFFGRLLANGAEVKFTENAFVMYRRPTVGNVSRVVTKSTLNSRLMAWKSVQNQILKRRSDRIARKAILRRLRAVAYAARHSPDIVKRASTQEKKNWQFDLNSNAPAFFAIVSAFFGLKFAIRLRAHLRRYSSSKN